MNRTGFHQRGPRGALGRLTVGFLLLLGLALTARAAPPARVELVPPQVETAWVGQRVAFSVDLLGAGVFAGAPRFDLPETPGAVLMKTNERPTLLTRTVDEQEYVVQRHDFALFLTKPGTFRVPPIGVRFGTRPSPRESPAGHSLTTGEFAVTAKEPQGGADGAWVVSTRKLQVSETWNPAPENAKAGAAFVRTVTVTAEDVPGMLLPPVETPVTPGVTVYPREPQVRDRMERGEFSGTRVESLTYVCEQPGTVEIPEVLYRWWDVASDQWRVHTLPAVTFQVVENPAFAGTEAGPAAGEGEEPARRWLGAVIGALGVLFALLAGWGATRRARKRRLGPEGREAQAFRKALDACRGSAPSAAYGALTAWISCRGSSPLSLEAFLLDGPGEASEGGRPAALRAELRSLQVAILQPDVAWRGAMLARLLAEWRKESHGQGTASRRELPELNPGAAGLGAS